MKVFSTRKVNIIAQGVVLSIALLLVMVSRIATADEWRYEITPYLWGAGLSGNTAADGIRSPVDSDYSFFSLDNLEAVASAGFTAQNQRWGFGLDSLYVNYSDNFNNAIFNTDVDVDGGFVEATVSYRLSSGGSWEILAGARYVTVGVELKLTPGPMGKQDKDWLDPLIGARYSHDFNVRWFGQLRADVGGFGVSSDLATNLMALIGYRLNETISVKFAYRYINLDYKKDRFVYDASLQGLGVGVGIAF